MTLRTFAMPSNLGALIMMVAVGGLNSQAQTPRNLVTVPVDETQLVTLHAQVHPGARAENDQGRIVDSMPMSNIIMLLNRTPEQQQALTALIDNLHNRRSPSYHQWVTPEQFGTRFGASDSDLSTITTWMESHGFTIEEVVPGRNLLIFSGDAGQVREAFHTEIHQYLVNGEPHYSNNSEPQVPAALAPLIAGFRSLNDFRLRPLKQDAGVARHNMKTGEWEKISGPPSVPELTFTYGGGQYFFISPQDFYTIYNENPLLSATPKIDGHGVTIAVLEETNVAHTSDVTNFRQQFGLPAYPAKPDLTDGGVNWMIGPGHGCTTVGVTSTGEEGEALLDVEWAGAAAPKAIVDFVACGGSNGIDLAAQYVTNYLPATVVATSLSYGECEIDGGSSGAAYYRTEWEQEVAEGITPVVSSGDSGSLACDQNLPYAIHNLSVNEISDTPYNISAGGTDFSDFYQAHSYSTYWNTTDSTVPNGSSALSYIPEITWGSYCASPLFASYLQSTGSATFGTTYNPQAICNSPNAGPSADDLVEPVGGGGGVSAYNNLPTWQSVYGVGLSGNQTSTTLRNQPDLSFFASNGFWGHALVYCQSDTGYTCDYSNTGNDGNAYNLAAGGTSFVAPQIDGMMALVVQQTGARQGNANYTLYNLATLEYGPPTSPNSSNLSACSGSGQIGTSVGAGCIFRDIAGDTPNPWQGGVLTSGNVQPCLWADVLNCYRSSTVTYGLSAAGSHPATNSPAYPTSQGYDAATGLGSPNIANLVVGWNTVTPSFPSTSTISANPTTIMTTASTTLTATVTAIGRGETSAAGPPAVGTVNFYLGSTSGTLLGTGPLSQACAGTAPSNLVCPPSTATLVVQGTALGLGANSVIAYFPGDGANDAPSTSSAVSVTVNPTSGEPVAGVSPTSLTFGSQQVGSTSAALQVTLSNTGGMALAISNIATSGAFGQINGCGTSLNANSSCIINVTFTPSVMGTNSGSLTVTDNSNGVAGSVQSVSLTGTGIQATISLSPTSLSFGNQALNTASGGRPVTLTNTGTAPLTVASVVASGDYSAPSTCSGSLSPRGMCKITVTFTPTATGTRTGTVSVTGNASNSPQIINLTGVGVLPATLSPANVSYGNVAEGTVSAAKTLTLTNNQSVALTSISVSIPGNQDYSETNTCGTSIPAHQKCTITITLTPSVIGADNATLSVSDSASNSPQTAALTGRGTVPVSLTPASAAYSTQAVGTTSPAKIFTLSSSLNTTLDNIVISTSGDFAVSSTTCTTTLAAKGSCSIDVVFKPTETGTRTGSLSVSDSAGNSPQSSQLTGTGK